MSRNSLERIEETTDALQRMQSLLWSGIAQERKLIELWHLSSISDSASLEQAKQWQRVVRIEIPRQAGYALLLLDCSRCEAFLKEAIHQHLRDAFTHRRVSENKTACGINADECQSVIPPTKATCHRCDRADKARSSKNKSSPKFSQLKEEVRLSGLYAKEQESHWKTIEDMYAIRNIIAHQGGKLQSNDIGGQDSTLERLEESYREFNLVQQDDYGNYIWATQELCDHFRKAAHELLSSVRHLTTQRKRK